MDNCQSVSPIPERWMRVLVADAVHLAVTEITGSDGFCECLLYAYLGSHLCSQLLEQEYWLQVGSLLLKTQSDTDSTDIDWLRFDTSNNKRGSYHAWFGAFHDNGIELVDLSARHYQGYADSFYLAKGEKPKTIIFPHKRLWHFLKKEDEANEIFGVNFNVDLSATDTLRTLVNFDPRFQQGKDLAIYYFGELIRVWGLLETININYNHSLPNIQPVILKPSRTLLVP